MWSIPTRKYSGATRSKRGQGGQAALEYLLILVLVVSMFVFGARPFFRDFSQKFQDFGKKGFFSSESDGSQFYYFPLPKRSG